MVANEALKIDIPSQLDDAHQAKLEQLNDARGQGFFKTYPGQQVDAHKQAISLFEGYAKTGDHPNMENWAAKTVPTLKHHLQMAEQLDQSQPAATTGMSNHK